MRPRPARRFPAPRDDDEGAERDRLAAKLAERDQEVARLQERVDRMDAEATELAASLQQYSDLVLERLIQHGDVAREYSNRRNDSEERARGVAADVAPALASAEELKNALADAPLDVRAKAETLVGQLRGLVQSGGTLRRRWTPGSDAPALPLPLEQAALAREQAARGSLGSRQRAFGKKLYLILHAESTTGDANGPLSGQGQEQIELAYSCTEDLAKEIDVVIASDEQSCIETARGLFPEHSPQFQPAGTSPERFLNWLHRREEGCFGLVANQSFLTGLLSQVMQGEGRKGGPTSVEKFAHCEIKVANLPTPSSRQSR